MCGGPKCLRLPRPRPLKESLSQFCRVKSSVKQLVVQWSLGQESFSMDIGGRNESHGLLSELTSCSQAKGCAKQDLRDIHSKGGPQETCITEFMTRIRNHGNFSNPGRPASNDCVGNRPASRHLGLESTPYISVLLHLNNSLSDFQ